jgi:hypothetical protein
LAARRLVHEAARAEDLCYAVLTPAERDARADAALQALREQPGFVEMRVPFGSRRTGR